MHVCKCVVLSRVWSCLLPPRTFMHYRLTLMIVLSSITWIGCVARVSKPPPPPPPPPPPRPFVRHERYRGQRILLLKPPLVADLSVPLLQLNRSLALRPLLHRGADLYFKVRLGFATVCVLCVDGVGIWCRCECVCKEESLDTTAVLSG